MCMDVCFTLVRPRSTTFLGIFWSLADLYSFITALSIRPLIAIGNYYYTRDPTCSQHVPFAKTIRFVYPWRNEFRSTPNDQVLPRDWPPRRAPERTRGRISSRFYRSSWTGEIIVSESDDHRRHGPARVRQLSFRRIVRRTIAGFIASGQRLPNCGPRQGRNREWFTWGTPWRFPF